MLNKGMRSPSWVTFAVLVTAAALVGPFFAFGEIDAPLSTALVFTIFFLLTEYLAFNTAPAGARIRVLALWFVFALGFWVGGHGPSVSWLVVGAGALFGAEVLSRACDTVRSTAVTDPLTGLHNRVGLLYESERAIAICRRMDQPLTLVHIDLDGFKSVNDREGHSEGDRILRLCADNWTEVIRAGDILARVGGDEFLLMLPGSNADDARRLVGVLKGVSPIGWSFGVAELAPDEDLRDCIDRADVELYAQKGLRI